MTMPRYYVCATLLLAANLPLRALDPECSLAKTNHSCTLIIDRLHPLAPPAVQMYPGSKLTVVVWNPYYFERYFLDYSSGQLALNPDIATAIATGLAPSLKGLNEFRETLHAFLPPQPPPPEYDCSVAGVRARPIPATAADVTSEADTFYSFCLADFAQRATGVYHDLELTAAPDSRPQHGTEDLPGISQLVQTANTATELYQREAQLSLSIATAAKLDITGGPNLPGSTAPAGSLSPGQANLDANQAARIRSWAASAALADAVAKDLYAYATRIDNLREHPPSGVVPCADLGFHFSKDSSTGETPNPPCVPLFPIDDPIPSAKQFTRQLTFNIDALNLVQNPQPAVPDPAKKRTLAAVTILYGETRWEASAGTLFSTLANRSFGIAPVISSGGVDSQRVNENILHPTILPFAAANIRIGDDWKAPRWRMALYWTLGIGINPNTTSTDFVTGPSISWRALMFSALWHAGHDVRLTQGLYPNEMFDAKYNGGAPSQTYWRLDRVALGISVRVPSLTGR